MQGDPYDISKEKAMMAYKQVPTTVYYTMIDQWSLHHRGYEFVLQCNEWHAWAIHVCITIHTNSKWFLQAIGPEGIGKMLDGFEDKTGYAQTIISYMGPELKEPISFIGQTKV